MIIIVISHCPSVMGLSLCNIIANLFWQAIVMLAWVRTCSYPAPAP